MALDSYSGLLASIADTLNRTDLTTVIPDFVTLAEAQLNRRLRTRRMVGRSTASLTGQYIALPDDFGGPRSMILSGTSPKALLTYVEPSVALKLQQDTYLSSGQPQVYSVVGEEFEFLPTPDGTYALELTYWKRIDALSVSNTSNWVLEDHPDAYLYGSLLQSAPYLMEDERLTSWGVLFSSILDDINREDSAQDYGGRLAQRPTRVFG